MGQSLAAMISRRKSLEAGGFGEGAAPKVTNPLAPRPPHFTPKAKRVIYLFMGGALSQLDLFDYKPTLAKYNGKPIPQDVVMGQKYAFIKPDAALYASEFKFAKRGACGAELSETLPHLAEVVDDIAIVKSMTTDAFNHAPAQVLMQTGSTQFGRPCFGSWALYGLGSEAQNLPGFRGAQFGGRPQRRGFTLRQRVPAYGLPGRAVPEDGRPGALPLQPGGRHRQDAAPDA
jgi:hypothetical protein